MPTTVTGVFRTQREAEAAVKQLRKQGFGDNEISIITKDTARSGQSSQNRGRDRDMELGEVGGEDVSQGAAWGGAAGGAAGLLAGLGALSIPGIGPILAAGPLAGALTGMAAGGLGGALIDYGIPENEGRRYEEDIKKGEVLVAIKSSETKVADAARIFRENGAHDVVTH